METLDISLSQSSSNSSASTMSDNESISASTDITCRICLESTTDSSTGVMLTPCNCKGSMAFIHDICLKKLILYNSKGEQNPLRCQICRLEYQMSLNVRYEFRFRKIPQEETRLFILLLGLLIILLGLSYAIWYWFTQMVYWIQSPINNSEKLDKATYNISWLMVVVIIVLGAILAIGRVIFITAHVDWKIFSQDESSNACKVELKDLKAVFEDDALDFEDVDISPEDLEA